MKVVKYLTIVLAGIIFSAGCQKEFSIGSESGAGSATGSLKNELGDCIPVAVNGNYAKDGALTDSNFIVVQVNFSKPGTFKIFTDTSNGFSFQASGATKDSGLQSIRLTGAGKPVLGQSTVFVVAFDTSVCMFSVNVTDSAIATPVTSGDYFPTTDSSNWTYINGSTSDTFNVRAATTDRNFGGNFRIFVNNYGPDNSDSSYYRKKDGIYYTYNDFNDFGLYNKIEKKVEYIFLKDNVPEGSTWESPEVNATLDSIDGKSKIMFTIEGKDIKTSIGATTFDSVIQVKQEYMFAPSLTGEYETVVTSIFYYAKNIGFIKAEAYDPFPVSIDITKWEIYY